MENCSYFSKFQPNSGTLESKINHHVKNNQCIRNVIYSLVSTVEKHAVVLERDIKWLRVVSKSIMNV